MNQKLKTDFYQHDVLKVATKLLGKRLVRKFDNNSVSSFKITEVEAYRGIDDRACHASKGKTARTSVLYDEGGKVYVYLIYGIYWLLNFVTGDKDDPSAVLIRGINNISGPGRVGKVLQLDKSFYGENLSESKRIWIEDAPDISNYICAPRVGIDYAGEPWISKPWRFIVTE